MQEAVKRPNQSKDLYRLLRTLKRSDPSELNPRSQNYQRQWLNLKHLKGLSSKLGLDDDNYEGTTNDVVLNPKEIRLINELFKLKSVVNRLYRDN